MACRYRFVLSVIAIKKDIRRRGGFIFNDSSDCTSFTVMSEAPDTGASMEDESWTD